MKKFLYLISLLLCLTCVLSLMVACTEPDEPDPSPSEDEQQDTPPAQEMVAVVTDGQTSFRIVRGDLFNPTDVAVKAAVSLREAIVNATSAAPDITTDYTEVDEAIPEILVGETNRASSAALMEGLAENEFIVQYDGHDILLIGKTQTGTKKAVEYFLTTYLGYNEADGSYANANVSIPVDLNYRGSFELPAKVYMLEGIRSVGGGAANNEDYNDVVRFYTCLQGRLNKTAKENGFYVYQKYDSEDQFWLDYIMGDGKMLENADVIKIGSWKSLWETLGDSIKAAGIVLWDPAAPATSNVASTVCSVEGYLPVRYDTDADSLYSWLIGQGVEVKLDLCGMFDGELGTKIADTDIDSSGSIKCDPYLWALEKYGDRVNPEMVAYTLDGASQVESNVIYQKAAVATTPDSNQLFSHDYYIYNECFFVDLTCKADEKPCDDPDQPMGTDAKTLGTILGYFQERNNGKFGKLMGFPPWYMKYTVFNNWGKSGEVQLEWSFVAFITGYDFIKEADAWNPSWMTNASVYCQYEMTTEKFENNKRPRLEEGFDDRIRYFTVYIGDYDSSAWLKLMVPDCFESNQRGQMPMMWAFNPNLSDRVPMIFDYVYENKTANDYFITGDSGAGYVFPSRLADLDKWVDYNEPYLSKFDMDIVGFIIDDKPLSLEAMEAYAEIAPLGGFVNTGDYLTILNDETVFLRMWGSVQPVHNTDSTREGMYNELHNSRTNFAAYRTIRQYTNDLVGFVNSFLNYAEAKNDGYEYQYVDMYTLFELILESGQGKYVYSE